MAIKVSKNIMICYLAPMEVSFLVARTAGEWIIKTKDRLVYKINFGTLFVNLNAKVTISTKIKKVKLLVSSF